MPKIIRVFIFVNSSQQQFLFGELFQNYGTVQIVDNVGIECALPALSY